MLGSNKSKPVGTHLYINQRVVPSVTLYGVTEGGPTDGKTLLDARCYFKDFNPHSNLMGEEVLLSPFNRGRNQGTKRLRNLQ